MSSRNLAQSAAPAAFPWRRVTLAALTAAVVVGLAALAGPTWMIRVGAVIGIAAGVVAAVLAVHAFRRLDERHRESSGAQVAALERRHGEGLRKQRRHDAEVTDTLRGHLRARTAETVRLRDRLGRAHRVIEDQRGSLDRLHTEGVELRRQLDDRGGVIAGLRETLTTREEELAALLGDVDEAEIYAMPRRVRSAERAAAPDPSDLVDLATLKTANPAPAKGAELRQA